MFQNVKSMMRSTFELSRGLRGGNGDGRATYGSAEAAGSPVYAVTSQAPPPPGNIRTTSSPRRREAVKRASLAGQITPERKKFALKGR